MPAFPSLINPSMEPQTRLPDSSMIQTRACRFCMASLQISVVDLGMLPSANRFRTLEQSAQMEPTYPLHAYFCEQCGLVQLEKFHTPDELFSDYAYFSSYSDSWVIHADQFVTQMTKRLDLGPQSRVIEIASNDGYLLAALVKRGIPAIGIEPAVNIATAARASGLDTRIAFFGTQTAHALLASDGQADLLIANNVLAHVPDINDFFSGMALMMPPTGLISIEVPHLLQLIQETQFDTLYHEHFSYFSARTLKRIAAHHGLTLIDAERLQTHGGSLRLFFVPTRNSQFIQPSPTVAALLAEEQAAGLDKPSIYQQFAAKTAQRKRDLLALLIAAKNQGKQIIGYGAPAKGNTLLGYCGIGPDILDYTVDRNPYKQGKFLPGNNIRIFEPERIQITQPDYILILPWNLADEITTSLAYIANWGGRFIIPMPQPIIREAR